MSLADEIRKLREGGLSNEAVYTTWVTSVMREATDQMVKALAEIDGDADQAKLQERVVQNMAASAIQIGAATLAQRDVDITLHYLATVARTLVPDEPAAGEPKTPKDTSKLN